MIEERNLTDLTEEQLEQEATRILDEGGFYDDGTPKLPAPDKTERYHQLCFDRAMLPYGHGRYGVKLYFDRGY